MATFVKGEMNAKFLQLESLDEATSTTLFVDNENVINSWSLLVQLFIHIFGIHDEVLLIHSADSKSRPLVIIMFTLFVRPSVRPFTLFKISKYRVKIMIGTDGTVGLANGIIDDTYVLYSNSGTCECPSWKDSCRFPTSLENL